MFGTLFARPKFFLELLYIERIKSHPFSYQLSNYELTETHLFESLRIALSVYSIV